MTKENGGKKTNWPQAARDRSPLSAEGCGHGDLARPHAAPPAPGLLQPLSGWGCALCSQTAPRSFGGARSSFRPGPGSFGEAEEESRGAREWLRSPQGALQDSRDPCAPFPPSPPAPSPGPCSHTVFGVLGAGFWGQGWAQPWWLFLPQEEEEARTYQETFRDQQGLTSGHPRRQQGPVVLRGSDCVT